MTKKKKIDAVYPKSNRARFKEKQGIKKNRRKYENKNKNTETNTDSILKIVVQGQSLNS